MVTHLVESPESEDFNAHVVCFFYRVDNQHIYLVFLSWHKVLECPSGNDPRFYFGLRDAF